MLLIGGVGWGLEFTYVVRRSTLALFPYLEIQQKTSITIDNHFRI